METTKLSSKGQVIIPKPFRAAHGWEPGQELVVINTGDGVLLKPKTPFQETNLEEVAACSDTPANQKRLMTWSKRLDRA
ncbi:MAG: AbrB/MazE/SpoVT family DNA-binding domain-containing protein [Candidatus Competibacteraceae bacterium]